MRTLFILQLLATALFMLVFVILFFWGFFLPYRYRVRWIKPFSVWWAKFIVRIILRLKVEVDYHGIQIEPKAGYVSVSNHLSFLDIPILTAYAHKMYVMKKSLLYTSFGWGAYLSGALWVKRDDPRDQLRTMRKLVKVAKEVEAVHLFPEGSRSENGKTLPFKRGALHKLFHENVPVLAIGLWGTQEALPKKGWKLNPRAPIYVQVQGWVDPAHFTQFEDFHRQVEYLVHLAVGTCQKKVALDH